MLRRGKCNIACLFTLDIVYQWLHHVIDGSRTGLAAQIGVCDQVSRLFDTQFHSNALEKGCSSVGAFVLFYSFVGVFVPASSWHSFCGASHVLARP